MQIRFGLVDDHDHAFGPSKSPGIGIGEGEREDLALAGAQFVEATDVPREAGVDAKRPEEIAGVVGGKVNVESVRQVLAELLGGIGQDALELCELWDAAELSHQLCESSG